MWLLLLPQVYFFSVSFLSSADFFLSSCSLFWLLSFVTLVAELCCLHCWGFWNHSLSTVCSSVFCFVHCFSSVLLMLRYCGTSIMMAFSAYYFSLHGTSSVCPRRVWRNPLWLFSQEEFEWPPSHLNCKARSWWPLMVRLLFCFSFCSLDMGEQGRKRSPLGPCCLWVPSMDTVGSSAQE